MFTVEFESDASIITTLDERDKFEDVEVILADDGSVYMRQFDNSLEEYQMLFMSYQQVLDIFAALSSKEGAYYATPEDTK